MSATATIGRNPNEVTLGRGGLAAGEVFAGFTWVYGDGSPKLKVERIFV